MSKKEKGPDDRNRTDPKRMAEAKRLFKSKRGKLESKEAQLFLRFLHLHPEVDLTLATAEALWTFLAFMKKHGYHIIGGDEVFCVPFSNLVPKAALK